MITEAVTLRHPQQLTQSAPSSLELLTHPTFKASGLLQQADLFPSPYAVLWKCCLQPHHLPLLHSQHTHSTETLIAELTQNCFLMLSLLPKALKTLTPLHNPHYLSGFFILEKQHEESVHKHPTLTKTPHIQLFSCHKPAWKHECSQSVDS